MEEARRGVVGGWEKAGRGLDVGLKLLGTN